MSAPSTESGARTVDVPWPTRDIIYVSIIGSILVAALLEWLLWLLAFLYCLAKVYQKAQGPGRWSIRLLAVLNIFFFIAVRCVFLPIMLVTLPLPGQIVEYIPRQLVADLQWIAFWSFAGLLIVPWLVCVYQLVTRSVGRKRRIKTVLDEYSAPKVVIVMPCYNEEPDVLLRTVDSIVDCDYPPSCMHVFLSFDGDQENALYLNTIEKLGVPLTLECYPRSIDIKYRSCRITVSRFPHGGKRSCQKKSFKLIDKVYAEYLRRHDDLFLLFIDSDCILDRFCIQNFMYEMELRPGSKRTMLAMTGVITSTTTKNSLITVLQDMEYIHGQLFERSVESGCGAVTCLPGALTILRFSAFRRMAKYYFADKAEQCDDLFDYGKCHLGEDRWLTHLFMIGAKERYQIQMNTGAFCKTEAVQTFTSLLKQRRRWFLGFVTNEACLLTDARLWKRYPLIVLIRLASNTIRTTALLFFIFVIAILTTEETVTRLPVGFMAVSLGLNWVLMLYFGAKLGRYKIMLYPLMFLINPFLNWLYMVYGIFTAGQRTWGGPRADAGKADANVTPEEVIEKAAKDGDVLNVVPETFKPAIESSKQKVPHQAPLLPSEYLAGRFAPAEELPGGWYRQENDSGALHADMTPRHAEEGRVPYSAGQKRGSSIDSFWSTASHSNASSGIVTPRRVESLVDVEGARRYRNGQLQQRPAGGAYFERGPATSNLWHQAPVFVQSRQPRAADAESIRTTRSDSSVSLHFGVPRRASIDGATSPALAATTPGAVRASARSIARSARLRETRTGHTTEPDRVVVAAGSSQHPYGQHAAARNGRSPLARKSYTKLATDEVSVGDGRGGVERVWRRHSVTGIERQGRRSVSVDRFGRRRLSKQGRGGRAEST